jgi:VIT1/CCC1 family predicted Fe2+/Mn2+ transporter
LDNGKGSRLLGALLAEHGLEVGESHRSLFKDVDLLGSFDNDLMRQSNAIGRSLGTQRTDFVARQQRVNRIRVATRRFLFAIAGGLIIIVPLLILLVGEELPISLGVISTSIAIFAICVAAFTRLEPENLLASTAAYAAVLVGIIGHKQCR